MEQASRELDEILESTDDLIVLKDKLNAFADRYDRDTLLNLAPRWTTHLAQRNMGKEFNVLRSWFRDYMPLSEDFINNLLQQVAPTVNGSLYALLYAQIFTPERWQHDVATWVASDMDNDTLAAYLNYSSSIASMVGVQTWRRYRTRYNLPDEAATALFLRDPARFRDTVAFFLDFQTYDYPRLLEATRPYRHQQNETLFWWTFREQASRDDWHAMLEDIVENPPDNVQQMLRNAHPKTTYEMDDAMLDRLLAVFGDAIKGYLKHNSIRYGKREIRTALEQPLTGKELFNIMNDLQRRQREALFQTADEWAIAVYERDPQLFDRFLKYNLKAEHADVIRALLPRIRQNNQLDLYQSLYGKIIDRQTWNNEVMAVLGQDKASGLMRYDLDWLDIKSPLAILDDTTATALLQRDAATFYDFMVLHLGADTRYPQLQVAARQGDDDSLWWAIFREIATDSMWQAEMQRLLQQDIPSERINGELEKRHPKKSTPNPELLHAFIERYGEAVMPYIEAHIQMLTENRLRDLLALNISRGALRGELEKLARRQPRKFQDLTHIWLPAIYDGESTFWDKFILRFASGGRDNIQLQTVLQKLLPRMEEDGKDRLFRRFYGLVPGFYRREAQTDVFRQDIAEVIETTDDDEMLRARLERRHRATWQQIPPDIAVKLYQRNPSVFRPLLMDVLRRAYQGYNTSTDIYQALHQLAVQNDDTTLIRAYRKYSMIPEAWQQFINDLLEQQHLSAGQVLEQLETWLPRRTYNLTGGAQMIELLERYGEPLLPFVMENRSWISSRGEHNKRLLDVLAGIYPPDEPAYWTYFLQIADSALWNNALWQMLTDNPDPATLSRRLAWMTPSAPRRRFSGWRLSDDVAMELYKISPEQARHYIRVYTNKYSKVMFQFLQEQDEQLLLDYISAWYVTTTRWQRDDEYEDEIVDRLRRFYDESTQQFVEHVVNIFGQISAFRFYNAKYLMDSAVYQLVRAHRQAIVQSAKAVRDLLESPNIYIQLFAIEMLMDTGADAAQRTLENLDLFQAFLLSRAKTNSKQRVLTLLEHTVDHLPESRDAVLTVLENTKRMQGKRAIDEKLLVIHTRLHHQPDLPATATKDVT